MTMRAASGIVQGRLRAGQAGLRSSYLVFSIRSSASRMRITIWNIIYLAGFVVYVAIRGVFDAKTKGHEKAVSRADLLDRALLAPVFLGNVLLPAAYLFTPRLAFADYRLPLFLPYCGTLTMIVALWLFWRAHVDLGPNWSITLEIRKDHELIAHGVYRRVRHPMYAAIFLFAIGQGLRLENWLAGWGGFGSFAVLYLVRTPREEKMMLEFFGASYRVYLDRTGRLWPRFGRGL
jgi:protein-S-isoprenylcysteine O-methyltransferase Ste14